MLSLQSKVAPQSGLKCRDGGALGSLCAPGGTATYKIGQEVATGGRGYRCVCM